MNKNKVLGISILSGLAYLYFNKNDEDTFSSSETSGSGVNRGFLPSSTTYNVNVEAPKQPKPDFKKMADTNSVKPKDDDIKKSDDSSDFEVDYSNIKEPSKKLSKKEAKKELSEKPKEATNRFFSPYTPPETKTSQIVAGQELKKERNRKKVSDVGNPFGTNLGGF